MKKFRFALIAAMVLAMLLSACSSQKPAAPAPAPATPSSPAAPAAPAAPTAVFHYYLVDKPTTFDPAVVTDVSTMQIIQNVYSGLVTNNAKGEVVNDMASKIDISSDGLTYTFTLKDATFSDGTKVTAKDYVRSIVRATNPGIASTVASLYLGDIKGISKFYAAQSDLDKKKKAKTIADADYASQLKAAWDAMAKDPGVVAKDDKTLVITLAQPAAYFLAKMTYPTSFVVGPNVPADKALIASPDSVKQAVGTGAFTLDSYTEGSKVVIKRNPNFYGDKAQVASVEMNVISADAAQLAAYQGGQIDMANLAGNDYPRVKADPTLGKEVLEFPTARINYLALNQNVWAPAKDAKVRQAIAMAIDENKLNQVVFNNTQFPAKGILPPAIPGALNDKINGYAYDPAKAKDLLKQAGYGDGGKQLTLKLSYRAKNEQTQRWAEFIQNALKTNLGMQVDLNPMEWSALLAASSAKDQLEAFLLGWSADYIDPQDFLSILLRTGSSNNRYGYSNPDVDKILDAADKMAPGAARFAEYGKAEQQIVTDLGFIPEYFGKGLYLLKPSVKGLEYSAMGILPLNHVSISK